MAKQPFGSYQIGTIAFTVGTAVWGVEAYLSSGRIDLAAAAYAVGCLYFLEDAFQLLRRLRPATAGTPPAREAGAGAWRRLLPSSYQAGSLAYAAGTVAWGLDAYAASATVDPAAVLYGVGCAYFLYDAYRPAGGADRSRLLRLLARSPVSGQQLGTIAFLAGTLVWGITGGVSVPVAAYGLGCLFYVRDAFARRGEPAAQPAP